MNIAIDGPAGAGKSTIARRVARELNMVYIDTGAMYRAVALWMLQHGVDPEDEEQTVKECENCDIKLSYENGVQHVFLNDKDVSKEIRQEAVGNAASKVSKYGRVREKLVKMQQALAGNTSVVMDGRDIGTVVLPNAELKIFLTADPRERALRRSRELREKLGEDEAPGIEEIEEDIRRRDYLDMNRKTSPLVKAPDAVLLDSSNMTIDEVCEKILRLASLKGFKE